MEIFLLIIAKVLVITSFVISIVQYKRMARSLDEVKIAYEENQKKLELIRDAQRCHKDMLDRILMVKGNSEPSIPMKPNNWDSVREALKRPSGILNE